MSDLDTPETEPTAPADDERFWQSSPKPARTAVEAITRETRRRQDESYR